MNCTLVLLVCTGDGFGCLFQVKEDEVDVAALQQLEAEIQKLKHRQVELNEEEDRLTSEIHQRQTEMDKVRKDQPEKIAPVSLQS